MQSFESTGLWFLPSNPDKQIAGRVQFSKKRGITLTLSGTFQADWTLAEARYDVIHGAVSESPYGKFLSLFSCFATSLKFGMPGLSLETIRANHAFVGNCFVEGNDTQFSDAYIYYSPLARWLRTTGLSMAPTADETTISWKRPPSKTADVPGARISSQFELATSARTDPPCASAKEIATLQIECEKPATADQIHSAFVGPLTRLMTFVSNEQTNLARYMLYGTRSTESDYKRVDRIYSPSEPSAPRGKRNEIQELLFSVNDLPEGFSAFISSWLSFNEEYKNFCAMFFSFGYEKFGYVERRMLLRMLACQLLAAERYRDDDVWREMSSVHDMMLKSKSVVTEPYARFIVPSIFHMASPKLLPKLFDEYWHLIGNVVGTSSDRFTSTLFSTLERIKTREDHDPDALTDGVDLAILGERLSAVIKLIMLRILGLNESTITRVAGSHNAFTYLKVRGEPWE